MRATFVFMVLTGVLGGVASAGNGTPIDQSAGPLDLAIIGDVPYGDAALALFPGLIQSINQDPKVRVVVHIGDIKSGSTVCSDAWFSAIRENFDTFKDPLVYTIGDNDWTDCHRDNNGNANPLERLDKLREVFFDRPGTTLGGRKKQVYDQEGYPENQLWMQSRVVFAAIHGVGSNNGLARWTCFLPFTADCLKGTSRETAAMTADREAEAFARDAANRAWLDLAFALADEQDAAGVALFLHANMWRSGNRAGHRLFVEQLAEMADDFGKPVLLVSGDTHDFSDDELPDQWFVVYGLVGPDNVTQVIVDRSIENDVVWLRLHVDPKSEAVFSWEEVEVKD